MKIFFTILFTIFICCHSVFAASAKAKKEEQQAQQKMDQLQQLLSRAMKTDTTAVPGNAPTLDAPFGAQQGSVQAPSAGLVSSPTSVDQAKNDKTVAVPASPPSTDSKSDAEAVPPKTNLYEDAFSSVVNQMLPMSSDQIAKLREVFTETQLAAATPPGIPPKPTSTSLLVNLSPRATPPVIRLGAGYITSLVFMDSTGQPWPIASYSLGDPTSFNVQWDRKGNTLLMQSSTFYKRSNLAVILRDLNTPIMISLLSGQGAIDYRVDLRVPGLGPNAIFAQSGIPESANPMLLDVLNGIAPQGSKELKVSGGDCKAWLLKDKLYLRTGLTINSPGWQAIMSSIDGTHAYQLQKAPIILAQEKGRDKIITLKLDGLD